MKVKGGKSESTQALDTAKKTKVCVDEHGVRRLGPNLNFVSTVKLKTWAIRSKRKVKKKSSQQQ